MSQVVKKRSLPNGPMLSSKKTFGERDFRRKISFCSDRKRRRDVPRGKEQANFFVRELNETGFDLVFPENTAKS